MISNQKKPINLIDNIENKSALEFFKITTTSSNVSILTEEKKSTIDSIVIKNKRMKTLIYTLIIVSISTLIILIYINSKRVLYKKRFKELMSKQNDSFQSLKSIMTEKAPIKTELNIPKNVIIDILFNLDKFEKNQDFLNSKMSIASLAKSIGTNPNYLSKTVNHFKKMSFSQYINTLRIRHSVGALKNNSVYRKYTLKAIASEFGFNNTESFSKAFYKETGTKPSFFIKNL
jgi:YesN/AraC family two-component response regulator